jgi:hypothetical protein
MKNKINFILISLVILDLLLSIWGFFFSEFWFSFFHNSAHVDPQGLLYRCAANWTAFFIIQLVAYFYWEKYPWLLVLVAGCRLGDVLTDITCLIFSSKHTIIALIGFPMAGIGNLIVGLLLIKFFKNVSDKGYTKTL